VLLSFLFGWLGGWLAGCLVVWLCCLVCWSLGRRIFSTIGRLVSCWMVSGSAVWSVGQLAIGSLVWLFGGMVGPCVGQLVCGLLEDQSVSRLDSQWAVWLVDQSIVWSVGLLLGQWMG
jgi:hypothetical protein